MTLIYDTPQNPQLEKLLEQLKPRINNAVLKVAEHANALQKHEVPISSRLAQTIADTVANMDTSDSGFTLKVFVEEFSPTEESRSGADLYISTVLTDDEVQISKGMLVQSKKRSSLRIAAERRRLRNQSARMRRRAPIDSHVMIFDETAVHITPAPKSSDPKLIDLPYNSTSMGELIAEAFRCNKGSPEIGIDPAPEPTVALRARLSALSAPRGIAFLVHRD